MADAQFNVDEILEEVRRRRAQRQQTPPDSAIPETPMDGPGFTVRSTPAPERPPAPAPPPAGFLTRRPPTEPESAAADVQSTARVVERGAEAQRPPARQAVPQPAEPKPPAPTPPVPPPPPAKDGFTVVRAKADGTLDFERIKRPRPQSRFAEQYELDTGEVVMELPTKRAGGEARLPADNEPVEEKYRFLHESRQQKVESFVLQENAEGQEPQAEPPAEPQPPVQEDAPLEYESQQDVEDILLQFKSLRLTLNIRLVVTGLCALFLLLLAAGLFGVDPGEQPTVFLLFHLAPLLLSAAISYPVMGGGLAGLFRFHADGDSMTAVAALAGLAQILVLLFLPSSIAAYGLQMMTALPALTLFCNAIGKRLHLKRVSDGFEVVRREGDKHAVAVVSRRLASSFSQIVELDAPVCAISVKTGFLTKYMELANTEDPSDRMFRTLCPVTSLGCIGVLALSLIFGTPLPLAITAMTAAFGICAPFAVILCSSLPMLAVGRRLKGLKALITGYAAVEEFEDVDSVVLNAAELFPEGSVTLHGIKALGIEKIDENILDAASIVCYAKSTLAPVFLQVIQGQTKLLRPVDNVVYEDGMGVSGWVDGKRVLVGNRDLLQHHGIDVPNREYEARFVRDHRDVVYLATSGEISAMFVLSYAADPKVEAALNRLLRSHLSILVKSTDPNITARKIASVFTYPVNMVKIIPGKAYSDYRELTRKKASMPANIVDDGSLPSFAGAMSGARALRGALKLSTLLLTVGLILGFLVVAVLALTIVQEMGPLTLWNMLLYQLLWLALILAVPNIRKI